MLDFQTCIIYNILTVKIDKLYEQPARAERRMKMETMTRLELLTLLYSLQALIESNNSEKAKEVIDKVIKEAENTK